VVVVTVTVFDDTVVVAVLVLVDKVVNVILAVTTSIVVLALVFCGCFSGQFHSQVVIIVIKTLILVSNMLVI